MKRKKAPIPLEKIIKQQQSSPQLKDLNSDVIENIVKIVGSDIEYIFNLRLLNTYFYQILEKEYIWKHLFSKYWEIKDPELEKRFEKSWKAQFKYYATVFPKWWHDLTVVTDPKILSQPFISYLSSKLSLLYYVYVEPEVTFLYERYTNCIEFMPSIRSIIIGDNTPVIDLVDIKIGRRTGFFIATEGR